MFAPVYRTLLPAVRHLVGERIYGSGSAPQGVVSPYITWFLVVGQPYDQLSDAPAADKDTIQIDCWAGPGDDQELVCMSVARAVRDALDSAGQSSSVILNTREADTKLFRIGFRVEFIHNR
ncbi:DUF3168 domain-containing protein [Alcaligenes endophyticus]|uniref:DUF3168 domain-containing protein n=1 Tax=Alcaligenes endophyticus TaxID=1929088 RepID=A0ABT8EP29_9BURK|nr:DUF3168 domain-containing protein [Alcaligenes endophyticus]MCX5592798.1 DUF3168 domain-containing protein [Alcaligenes endophyticus]MDN4122840.1 DUF3168 domain-containing protein [Alcaligenes endophyticus]